MTRPLSIALLGLLASILLGGCASASLEIGVTTRATLYEDIGDPLALMTDEPTRVAVLPTIMTNVSPGQGVLADLAIDKAMTKDYRPFSLVAQEKAEPFTALTAEQTTARCIEAGKADELRRLIGSTQPGNFLDPELLAEVGGVLGVEYLLVPQVVFLNTDNAGRFTFTGLTFIRTGWISLVGTLQLWHVSSRELAWQSAGESSLTAENVVGISPPTQAGLDALFTTLVGDLVTGREQSVVSGKVSAPPSANPTNQAPEKTGSTSGATSGST
ncbi:MAG: hypothetical protein VX012_08795, partial [Planctomycetota bacterium]|nr:hypothetical protein [Planctomycetota bacterium]